MMKAKISRHAAAGLCLCLLVLSCSKVGLRPGMTQGTDRGGAAIEASCDVGRSAAAGGGMSTKAVIGQTTTTSIDANFLKLDETGFYDNLTTNPEQYQYTDFVSWNPERTQVVNASILSSPDNTDDIHFRSIVFNPRQIYPYASQDKQIDENSEIVGYATRMVGWYPKTCDVPNINGVAASAAMSTFSDKFTTIEGKTCIVFDHMLDGKTDIMVSDMREGRYDLYPSFKNNDSDRDIQPYGHAFKNQFDASGGYEYINYFTFNHYLTGVRLFIRADNSSLSLISWGTITDVSFPDQPQSVAIALPTEQAREEGTNGLASNTVGGTKYNTTATLPIEKVTPLFGEAMEWSDHAEQSIIKTAMADNDPDYPDFSMVADYPVQLDHGITTGESTYYLGYMLLKPPGDNENGIDVMVHTDAGVLEVTIPTEATYTAADGSTGTGKILQAGNIYNILLDIKTNGNLDVIVGSEDDESFYNLTPYNPTIADFEYSNCFVVTQNMMKETDSDNDLYHGFYFHAMVPGNGDRGFISGLYPTQSTFQPYSAGILWQDTAYLVTHVELVHGHIRFTLNDKCRSEGMEGNAVLAAYDRDGNILWTWHIWVVNDMAEITYPTLTFLDYENDTSGSLYYTDANAAAESKTLSNVGIMNMNLGATRASWKKLETTAEEALETYGLYYQWGRKDPLPGPRSYNYSQSDLTTAPYYYMDEGERTQVYEHLSLNPTVETAVTHPLDIIAPSQIAEQYPNDWLYNSINYLWGYSVSEKKLMRKTIYDPCPYGWRVADDELFALFDDAMRMNNTNISWTPGDYGIEILLVDMNSSTMTTNYFPYAGWKGTDRSRVDRGHGWYGVGTLGDYQDARICRNATNYMNHRGRSFLISPTLLTNGTYAPLDVPAPVYSESLTRDFANRTSAAPVRCVRYNKDSEEPAYSASGTSSAR